ncbi:MAG TPA: outer membrane beta-barrel protein [Myxococcota bacterium]|nr:outer membrane beta-barrel protein [Myxococcota bacterium]
MHRATPRASVLAASGSAFALVLACAPVASAGAPSDAAYDRSGPFAGAAGVYAFGDFDRKFDDSAGAELHLGYRVAPHLALEFVYQWLEGFDSLGGTPEPFDAVAPGEEVEIDTHQISLGAKVYGMTGRIQPYALVGVSLLVVNSEIVDPDFEKPYDVDVGPAGRFGGGVEYYATPHFVVGVEGSYLVPGGHVDGERFGTLGVLFQYRR